MAKRFTATEIWDEDWFLDMPLEYKLFWFYMLSNCDHSGIYKVNLRSFCGLNVLKLDSKRALTYFNNEKQRVRVLKDNLWFIEDFFVYQYGVIFNWNNRVHRSIGLLYKKYGIDVKKIRGLIEVKEGVKDKDKDKDKDNKDINKNIIEENEKQKFYLISLYEKEYPDVKKIFPSLEKEHFEEWKNFVDVVFKNNLGEIFKFKAINPLDFGKLKFPKEKWIETVQAILATGIKEEHNLFFRIPQFLEIVESKKNKNGQSVKSNIGKTIEFDSL